MSSQTTSTEATDVEPRDDSRVGCTGLLADLPSLRDRMKRKEELIEKHLAGLADLYFAAYREVRANGIRIENDDYPERGFEVRGGDAQKAFSDHFRHYERIRGDVVDIVILCPTFLRDPLHFSVRGDAVSVGY